MCHQFRLLCIYGVLANFKQVIVPFSIVSSTDLFNQQYLYIGVILQYNSGSMAANFEQVTVSIRLFFTWVMCIYILDKRCHISYVFGLNSIVYSHIVGVHLSSDQVTYVFMMDADLYNSFLLRLRIKRF